MLNFGHTMGHAIESYFLGNSVKKTLLHGEAVAIGMILEAFFSLEKKLISAGEYIEIKSVIGSLFEKISFTPDDINSIIGLLVHDKKNEFGEVNFVLLEGIGKAVINQQVENDLIYKAFNDYQK